MYRVRIAILQRISRNILTGTSKLTPVVQHKRCCSLLVRKVPTAVSSTGRLHTVSITRTLSAKFMAATYLHYAHWHEKGCLNSLEAGCRGEPGEVQIIQYNINNAFNILNIMQT